MTVEKEPIDILSGIVFTLKTAFRFGTGLDTPEGSCYIQISVTKVNEIIADLEKVIAKL